jgi:hypothetical protein
MLGISGAPRLLMTATRTATHTSVGMVARLRHEVSDGDNPPSNPPGAAGVVTTTRPVYHQAMTSVDDIAESRISGILTSR